MKITQRLLKSISVGLLICAASTSTPANAASLDWEKVYGGPISKKGMVLEETNYFGTFLSSPWNDLVMQYSDGTIILNANPGSSVANSFRSYVIKPDGKIKNTVLNNPTAFSETDDKKIVMIKASGSYKKHLFTLVKYQNTAFKTLWSTSIKATKSNYSLVDVGTLAVSKNNLVAAGTEYVPGDDWGTEAVLWNHDANGKLVWSKVISHVGANAQINAVKILDNGNIIVAGNKNNEHNSEAAWITAYDSNGQLLWEKTFGCSESVSDFTVMTDGNLLVASNVRTNYSIKPGYWNTEVGRTFWSTRLSVLNSASGAMVDEKIAQGAFPTETIADLCTGSPVVPENLVADPSSYKTSALEKTADGGYLLVGTKSTTMAPTQPKSNHVWVRKLDASLNQTWEENFASADSQYGTDIVKTISGKYLVGGLKQNGQRILRQVTE